MYKFSHNVNKRCGRFFMKKVISVLVIIVTVALVAFGIFGTQPKQEYIRIHVRANSNESIDQNVKYEIKDEIVSYLIPYISTCETREDFVAVINQNLDKIDEVAEEVLRNRGFSYGANVKFCQEQFPTRSYDSVVLESGIYDSLIVELGSGEGDNWWCVVYPPLCFVSNNSQDILYKSRILEILKSILG